MTIFSTLHHLTHIQILAIFFLIFHVCIQYALMQKNKYIFFIYVIPATLLHEISHWICALLLNGKPSTLSIIPKAKENGYILGSVTFVPKWYNAFLIGFSPILLSATALYLFLSNNALIVSPLFYWLISGGIPSFQDIKVAFRYSFVLILLILIYIFLRA